jgi:hypothetical protein
MKECIEWSALGIVVAFIAVGLGMGVAEIVCLMGGHHGF